MDDWRGWAVAFSDADRPSPNRAAFFTGMYPSCMASFAYANRDNCVNPYIMTGLAAYGPGLIFPEGPAALP